MATTESDQGPKVTLHWLNESRAQRIVWLLEETNLDYTIAVHKRSAEMLAPPELKSIHPLGKAPVVTIETSPSAPPLVLAESGFIVEYLTEHFAPHLVPARYAAGKQGPGLETESWLRYKFYLHYAEGSLMSIMVTNLIFNLLKGPATPFYIRPITRGIVAQVDKMYFGPNYRTHFAFLESQLASAPDGGEFLCGKDLTAADILLSFPLSAAKSVGYFAQDECPRLCRYVEMIEGLEGQKRAVARIEEVTGETYKAFSVPE